MNEGHGHNTTAQQDQPSTFTFTLFFVLINAAVWLVMGVLLLLGVNPALKAIGSLRWIFGALAIAAAGMMVMLYRQLKLRSRSAYRVTLSLFAAIAIVTLLDQGGWADALLLAITLVPLTFLFISRHWYFAGQETPSDTGQVEQ